MEFTTEQIKMAKRLSYGANLFQSQFFKDPLFHEQFEDGYKALICFVENYAYQRQGAPAEAYAKIGKTAIEQFLNTNVASITKNNVKEVWEKCQEIAERDFNGLNVNAINNPLNSNRGVLKLLATRKIIDNNLALHVKHLLENGKTNAAHKLMDDIRGVGAKIASLYLRDIAYLARIPENMIEDQYLLQPIDTWLEQTLSIIFGRNVSRKSKEKQELIVNLCRAADVSPVAFNQGAWVLGSQIAGEYKTFQRIVEGKGVESIIKKQIEEEESYVTELKRLLQDWPKL